MSDFLTRNCSNHMSAYSLVFIHGLDGHPFETWTDSQNHVFWPRDLMPSVLPGTRVLTYGYNEDTRGNRLTSNLRDSARSLMHRLMAIRQQGPSTKPIVFVSHCLGGLIVKQSLVFAHNEPEFEALATATRGLVRH
jgi:hypothetical protein